MALDDLRSLETLLPKCSDSFTNEEPCIEFPGRGSAFIYTSTPICIASVSLPGVNALPRWLLSIVYLALIFYLFLGVSLASDLFCDGIYMITNTKRKVLRRNQRGEWVEVEVPVWNWVVANITLMALGTSAPEIVLATVEALLRLGQPAGVLGPACIVGSAAYNFLMITACCTLAVPTGTFKKVTELRVYIATATWSIFAYIWMLVVYSWWTPNKVTLLEALLTLMFFVLLVSSAWAIDVRIWKGRTVIVPDPPDSSGEARDPETAAAGQRALSGPESRAGSGKAAMEAQRASHALQLTMPARPRTLSDRISRQHHLGSRTGSRLRTVSGRTISGDAGGGGMTAAAVRRQAAVAAAHDREARRRAQLEPHLPQIAFRTSAYSCLLAAGAARVIVVRSGGDLSLPLQVYYETQDGDAIAGVDYKASRGAVHFQPGEQEKSLEIKIIGQECGVAFWVVLSAAPVPGSETPGAGRCPAIIVQERVRVSIGDDDLPGVLSFEAPVMEAAFRAWQPWVEVVVVRRGGQDGPVQVAYQTEDGTAAANRDYVPASGLLTFETGEKTAVIKVELLAAKVKQRSSLVPLSPKASVTLEAAAGSPASATSPTAAARAWVADGPLIFRLRLSDPTGGATLGARAVTTITLGGVVSDGGGQLEAPGEEAVAGKAQDGGSLSAARSRGRGEGGEVAGGVLTAAGGEGGPAGGGGGGGGGDGGKERSCSSYPPPLQPCAAEEMAPFDLWAAYREQFYAAFSVPQPEEGDSPRGLAEHWLHFFSMSFKVVFAVLVPPAAWRGGYPCFFAALSMVIALVYVLEQAASLLGCVTGLSEFMVGISLVAAGTSLPDTFASVVAARTDSNADAAVGNITGSNCVNVFLGLGLPWTISAVYSAIKGRPYEAPAGDLAFAVGLFAVFFAIAITLQFIRRYQGGELGGSRGAKLLIAGTFISMWVLYLVLSGLRSTGKLEL